ncbi:MAG: T9SS type A sorting domain-containing protein [Rhodothermales bacterium]
MNKLFLAFVLFIIGTSPPLLAQTVPSWQLLPDAPVVSRHNDAYFVTPESGWIVNGAGEIFNTEDGGDNWQLQLRQSASHFRSVGFVDDQRGWAGNVGEGEFGTTDANVLYQTNDGGQSWTPYLDFEGPTPKGLCGMYVVNDSTVVGVGRVRGPSFFIKTTDGGATWISKDMSAYAAGLIDVYFFNPDVGIAVGLTNADHEQSSGVILHTSDGGETWETRFTTTRTGEWFWKISFPSDQVGYISLQRNSQTPIYFVKTTDGGATWEEKIFYQSYYFVQGIGFINETTGWIGGNSSFPTMQTTDGGETWYSADFGARVNRFRFLGDSLGYAVGRSVYKLNAQEPVDIADEQPIANNQPVLFPNFPNPFNPTTTVSFELPNPGEVTLAVYDVMGRLTRTLSSEQLPVGRHEVVFDASGLPSGTYLIRMDTPNGFITRKAVLLK